MKYTKRRLNDSTGRMARSAGSSRWPSRSRAADIVGVKRKSGRKSCSMRAVDEECDSRCGTISQASTCSHTPATAREPARMESGLGATHALT